MYIEKNGYVVMTRRGMSFLDSDGEETDNYEEAEVYFDFDSAFTEALLYEEENDDKADVICFHQTTFLDKLSHYVYEDENKEEDENGN